ncbi:MAG TPA: hypothetical protein VL068_13300 [Microthrixaceae bacterium]|nr:hypothetical protein [Microthrixaceae bacterium]
MAAPEYVPLDPTAQLRSYGSPPRRAGSWMKDRPAEIRGLQPIADRLGVTGPDPGYALTMAARYKGKLHLGAGEKESDALAGAGAIAMKRAALTGRAPILADVKVALTIWGFLNPNPPAELVELRTDVFEEVHNPADYPRLRTLADMVPSEVLAADPDTIARAHNIDWRRCLTLAN